MCWIIAAWVAFAVITFLMIPLIGAPDELMPD